MQQLSLFDPPTPPRCDLMSAMPAFSPVKAAFPVLEAWPPQDWLDASETAAEVGWQGAAFVTTGLQDAIRHNDEFLWEVLWTARYHLVDLGVHPACFALTMGDHEHRFVASWLEHSGILVRLDMSGPAPAM